MTSGPAPDPHAPSPSAPGHLPTIRLHEVFDDLSACYAWFVRLWPRAFWARQPDPIAACQQLAELRDQLDCMIVYAQEARRHVDLLWDLSFDDSARRRETP